MDAMAEIRETFFLECDDLLEALEADLNTMNDGEGDDETVNAVFRAVHSIKGGAGAFALEDLVRFAHKFETTLDEVRAGRLEPTPDVMGVFLRCGDILADLVHAARDETDVDNAVVDGLLAELEELCNAGGAAAPAEPEPKGADDEAPADDLGFQPISLDFGDDDDADSGATTFRIEFKAEKTLYAHGNETALLFRALNDLGAPEISCNTDNLPALDEIDPEGAYLDWTIRLETDQGEEAIREVFEFVEGNCTLTITEETSESSSSETPPDGGEADEMGFTPIAFDAEISLGDEPAVAEAEDSPAPTSTDPAPTPTPAVESKKPTTEKRAEKKQAASPAKATVRVDLDRVDRLINLVGELVINQAMLSQSAQESGAAAHSGVADGLEEFKQLTREIQESVMAIRAQPVKPLFQRMSRIVREAASATGKSVRLKTEGESAEVDKTVIERLSDPLTHMIRNAVDHGLETPEKREAAGKENEGTVRLSAAHRAGRVVIEVADDGAGINRERVKQIAIDKELIPADAELSDSEIDNLLFMPGFSTASSVSDLSGRGVGMDVVKRSIQALGGRISIASEPGKGSTFTISLPLTLAVLDGMVIRVADQTLVVPLNDIVETLKPSADDMHEICGDSPVIFVRDRFVPLVDVGHALGYRDRLENCLGKVIILIESEDGTLTALVVDNIQDQRQVVIKGLEDNYGYVPGVAAATILGDGRIALILDPDSLLSTAIAAPPPIQASLAAAGGAYV